MTLKVKIDDALLKRELNRLARRATPNNLLAALVSGAFIISNEAKAKAPLLSGTLRRSIHVGGELAQSSDGQFSDIEGQKAENGKAEVLIGTNLVYAAIHEFGGIIDVTPKMRAYLHYIGIHLKNSTTVIRIRAQPYLRPAFASKHRDALRKVRDVLVKLLLP